MPDGGGFLSAGKVQSDIDHDRSIGFDVTLARVVPGI